MIVMIYLGSGLNRRLRRRLTVWTQVTTKGEKRKGNAWRYL